jgi:hypothetical protein
MLRDRDGRGSISYHFTTGFKVVKVALVQFISEYFGFPCQFSLRQFVPSDIRGWCNGAFMAEVPRSLV